MDSISLLISTVISQQFKLSSMTTLYLSKSIDFVIKENSSITSHLSNVNHHIMDNIYCILILCVVGIGIYFAITRYKTSNYKFRHCIYDSGTISNVHYLYVEMPSMFQNMSNCDVGSIYDDSVGHRNMWSLPTVPTRFKIKDIVGTMQLTFLNVEKTKLLSNNNTASDVKTYRTHSPCLIIETNCDIHLPTFGRFLDEVRDNIVENKNLNQDTIIHGYHILKEKNELVVERTVMYYILRNAHHPQQKIKNFFCPNRDYLFKSITLAMKRDESWNGILYGSPGLGKSYCASVISYVFKRDLVSVDLRCLTKRQTYAIFNGDISIKKSQATSASCRLSKSQRNVYVIEEFDNTIRYLLERETKVCEEVVDGKIITKPPDPELLKVSDLLEILQGVIIRPRSIIVATTNDLDYIRDTLPALVRFGRLTPYRMEYINNDVYHDIIQRYFPDIDISHYHMLPTSHNIPTAEIVTYAKNACGDYGEFVGLMNTRLML